jgi:hypothetical protein
MEKRDFWCIPLKTYTDEVFGVTYVRVISQTHFESLKIPSTLAKFKHQHVLHPQYLLHIEAVKTRKNWIIKNVLSQKQIMQLDEYQDYLIQAQLITLLLKHLHEAEPTEILRDLTKYFLTHPVKSIDPAEFEDFLMSNLGFK